MLPLVEDFMNMKLKIFKLNICVADKSAGCGQTGIRESQAGDKLRGIRSKQVRPIVRYWVRIYQGRT